MKLRIKRQIELFFDQVIRVAVSARQAGDTGPLHDMVVMRYFFGRAVPNHVDDWHLPTLEKELTRLTKDGDTCAPEVRAALQQFRRLRRHGLLKYTSEEVFNPLHAKTRSRKRRVFHMIALTV